MLTETKILKKKIKKMFQFYSFYTIMTNTTYSYGGLDVVDGFFKIRQMEDQNVEVLPSLRNRIFKYIYRISYSHFSQFLNKPLSEMTWEEYDIIRRNAIFLPCQLVQK